MCPIRRRSDEEDLIAAIEQHEEGQQQPMAAVRESVRGRGGGRVFNGRIQYRNRRGSFPYIRGRNRRVIGSIGADGIRPNGPATIVSNLYV